MAKRKNGVNKAQAIKEALKLTPDASSREIVEAVAAQGVTVSTTYVANVKSTLNKKSKRKKGKKPGKRGRKPGKKLAVPETHVVAVSNGSVQLARDVKKLVGEYGADAVKEMAEVFAA